MGKAALIVIDLQNDYFSGGAFPLHNAEGVLEVVLGAIGEAQRQGLPVVLIQHLADNSQGKAPFFNPGTCGADIHPRVLAAAPEAPIIVKRYADSFEQTELHECLQRLGVEALILCGMMTQNCVTHTALSRRADDYGRVSVLNDACATVSAILNAIALRALSTRVRLLPAASLAEIA